jgi:PhnB protein
MSEQTKPDPIPDNYRRITPCLIVDGAAKAIDFYGQVFGATERMRFPGPGGTVAHAEIVIGDSVVIVEDVDPRRATKAPPAGGLAGSPVFQFIYVDDVDATAKRLEEFGGTILPTTRTNPGVELVFLTDPDGVRVELMQA